METTMILGLHRDGGRSLRLFSIHLHINIHVLPNNPLLCFIFACASSILWVGLTRKPGP